MGAGTYGIVREADSSEGKVAVKIILKKNVKGNERMVYDELDMLQRLKHPHIVKFVDWFESRVSALPSCFPSCARPAGLPANRINTTSLPSWRPVANCSTAFANRASLQRKTPLRPSSRSLAQWTIYMARMLSTEVSRWPDGRPSQQDVTDKVLADLKPENLLYKTKAADSELVLADFGIAKMLDSKDEVLTTMAGSFGYAAPEVMLKKGHGKPVDMWSMGVITYTLLCGYSPFRSENLQDLIDECSNATVVFHERYWKDVSEDAKDFIMCLLKANPDERWSSGRAMKHPWLSGESATDHNLLPEIKAFMAKARLRRGIEMVKLANRIEALKMQEDDAEDSDMPTWEVPEESGSPAPSASSTPKPAGEAKKNLSKKLKGAIFREVVLAKVREMKEQEQTLKVAEEVEKEHKRRSFHE